MAVADNPCFVSCSSLIICFTKVGIDDENLAALHVFLQAWVAAEKDIAKLGKAVSANSTKSAPQWQLKVNPVSTILVDLSGFLEQTRARAFAFGCFHRHIGPKKRRVSCNSQFKESGWTGTCFFKVFSVHSATAFLMFDLWLGE
jgi:hypothetical protein